MTVVRCAVEGTYLVRDDSEPIPVGQTATDVSVVVHHYASMHRDIGWVCGECGYNANTTRPQCRHVRAAQEALPRL